MPHPQPTPPDDRDLRLQWYARRLDRLEDGQRSLRASFAILIIALLTAFALFATVAIADAHEFYEWKCCSGQDCAPLPDGGVVEGPTGYRLPATGETIPYADDRIRDLWSPDGRFHRCHRPDGSTRCLYTPGRGT